MANRILVKEGSTVVLRPVLPSRGAFILPSGPYQDMVRLAQNSILDTIPRPYIDYDATIFFGTTLQMSPTPSYRGYYVFTPDLEVGGVSWALGDVPESGVAGRLTFRAVNEQTNVVLVTKVLSSIDPAQWTYELSVTPPVDWSKLTTIDAPASTFTIDFQAAVLGGAGLTSFQNQFFSGPGGFSIFYRTSEAPTTLSGCSFNEVGEIESWGAFPYSVTGMATAVTSSLITNASVTGPFEFWTHIANLTAPLVKEYKLVHWSRSVYGAPSMFTVYDGIELSDPADQALLAALAVAPGGYDVNVYGGRPTILIRPGLELTDPYLVLSISPDWTTYEAFQIERSLVPDDHGGAGTFFTQRYWRDSAGNHYGLEDGEWMYRLYPDGIAPPAPGPSPDPDPLPGDGSPVFRSWGFTLDDHNFLVNRLGNQSTLLYDSKTGQWTPWASPNETVWTAHQGFNWLGMSEANYNSGAKSNIVAGDDETGVLWTLDPGSGLDDSTATPPMPLRFPRKLVGGLPARERQVTPISAVFLTVNVGEPTDSGKGSWIFLETSDDYGKTWDNQGIVALTAGDFTQEVVWRSLGLLRAPGRLFRFTDYGATVRVDGADILFKDSSE